MFFAPSKSNGEPRFGIWVVVSVWHFLEHIVHFGSKSVGHFLDHIIHFDQKYGPSGSRALSGTHSTFWSKVWHFLEHIVHFGSKSVWHFLEHIVHFDQKYGRVISGTHSTF